MSPTSKPTVEVEECFADNALDSDYSSDDYVHRAKRYATALENAELISRNLKLENLEQLRNQVKKDESEQLRYLSLDNATKEIEILEMKQKIERLENIVNMFEEYETTLKKFEKNSATYESLIAEVNIKDYKKLMNSEIQMIEITPPPTLDIPELSHTVNILNHTYNVKKKIEEMNREKFHDAIFWKAAASKHKMLRFIEIIFGLAILTLFTYNFFRM